MTTNIDAVRAEIDYRQEQVVQDIARSKAAPDATPDHQPSDRSRVRARRLRFA